MQAFAPDRAVSYARCELTVHSPPPPAQVFAFDRTVSRIMDMQVGTRPPLLFTQCLYPPPPTV